MSVLWQPLNRFSACEDEEPARSAASTNLHHYTEAYTCGYDQWVVYHLHPSKRRAFDFSRRYETAMYKNSEKRHLSGVVCLFCGRGNALPEAGREDAEERRIVIVRCQVCGKEAPYQADQIIALEQEPNGTRLTRAAGAN